ncbi:MAG: hypothetical protein AAFZ65_00210 [Planctomycetota bacterium]
MSGSDPKDPSSKDPQDLDLDFEFDGSAVDPEPGQKPTASTGGDEEGELRASDGSVLDLNLGGTAPTSSTSGDGAAAPSASSDPSGPDLGGMDLDSPSPESTGVSSAGSDPTASDLEPGPAASPLEPHAEAEAVYGSEAASIDPSPEAASSASDLEISDDAPEGAYERAEPVVATEGTSVSETAAVWDDAPADDSLGVDEIDFEAPVRRSNSKAVVIGAGLAGALAAAALAIVNPGRGEFDPAAPGLASVPTATPPAATPAEPSAPVEDTADQPLEPGFGGFESDQPLDLLTPMGGNATADYVRELSDRADTFAELTAEPSPPSDEGIDGMDALAKLLGGMFGGAASSADVELGADMDRDESVAFEALPEVEGADETDALRDSRTAQLNVMDQLLLPEDNTGIEFVGAGELEDIWMGEEIPPRGIEGRLVRLTPRVGSVRLITNLGEVFQGELYSIGAGEVSISNHLGQMTFSRRQIVEIVRMPAMTEALPIAANANANAERVRVWAPGGYIYGRKLAEDRGRVILLTDSGGRVTLPAKDVSPLGARAAAATPADDQAGIKQAVEDARRRQLEEFRERR